ncbi:type 1 glutamine amidotransferase [Marinomonas agarivorans]|nr:type 1 glutamine amidotransferase [Marinomonas agarivorans]
MKIALLLCDESNSERLIQLGGYQNMFFDLINPSDTLDVFPIYLNATNGADQTAIIASFPIINDYDGFIVSGSKAGVYEDHVWLPPLFECIRHIVAKGKKLVGVCFGHQAIAYALGGKVSKSHKGWGIGHYYNEWVNCPDNPYGWHNGMPLHLLTFHQDQVDELAPGFSILASSEFTPYFVTQYRKQILTTQGHPEMSPQYIEGLSYLLEEQIGADVVEKGRESLLMEDDTANFRAFIRDFWLQ